MKRILLCNDYTNEVCINFANPKSPSMLGIMQLHDHIMFFITLVLFLKLFFYIECIWAAIDIEIDILDLFLNYSAIEWGNNTVRRILLAYLGFRVKMAKVMKMNVYEHNPELEFIWTILPAIVLVFMALPSLYLLYSLESSSKPIYTIMIIGNQWYWTYQYVDFDVQATFVEVIKDQILNQNKYLLDEKFNIDSLSKDAFNFAKKKLTKCLSTDSLPIPDSDLPTGHPRLLSVDQPLILPANTEIRLLITSADVIHSWAVPSLGIKMDAIPGRLNQVVFKTPFAGTCWGQCSEICGVNHAIMPIEVRVVSLKDFETLIQVYLRDYLKAPLKEFMEMFFINYKTDVKKTTLTKADDISIFRPAEGLHPETKNLFRALFLNFLESLKEPEGKEFMNIILGRNINLDGFYHIFLNFLEARKDPQKRYLIHFVLGVDSINLENKAVFNDLFSKFLEATKDPQKRTLIDVVLDESPSIAFFNEGTSLKITREEPCTCCLDDFGATI